MRYGTARPILQSRQTRCEPVWSTRPDIGEGGLASRLTGRVRTQASPLSSLLAPEFCEFWSQRCRLSGAGCDIGAL